MNKMDRPKTFSISIVRTVSPESTAKEEMEVLAKQWAGDMVVSERWPSPDTYQKLPVL